VLIRTQKTGGPQCGDCDLFIHYRFGDEDDAEDAEDNTEQQTLFTDGGQVNRPTLVDILVNETLDWMARAPIGAREDVTDEVWAFALATYVDGVPITPRAIVDESVEVATKTSGPDKRIMADGGVSTIDVEARADALEVQIALATDLPNSCEMVDVWESEQCGDRAEVLGVLDSEYEETPINVWMCRSCFLEKSGSDADIIDAPTKSRIRRPEDAE